MMDPMAQSSFSYHALHGNEEDDVTTYTGAGQMRDSAGLRGKPRNASWRHRDDSKNDDRVPKATSFRWRYNGISTYSTFLCLMLLSCWVELGSAAFINFQNCLTEDYKTGPLLRLQFQPLFVDAIFDLHHNLNVTVYGNVNGTGPKDLVREPDLDNVDYWNSNRTELGGKIERQPDPDVGYYTTLFNKVNVVTYEPYSGQGVDFCSALLNGYECPLGRVEALVPARNLSDPKDLPGFGFNYNFDSSYSFASFTATLIIKNGDGVDGTPIGCISANITPDLGSKLSGLMTYVPLVVLIIVGAATAFAAIYSPWGTTDVFRWTTNYGRDADLLRLVTPGFGDCLQYLQFVALTGGLTLNYPGFYQPIVSKVAWSSLMFNQSFVSGSPGADSLVDGIYATHGLYGMDIFRQLIGMGSVTDVWAGMVIWLLVIVGSVLCLIQIGFLVQWISRIINKTHEEDLRAKNMPFSVGNAIRLVFNYFLLPAVALSMFQLVVATESPVYTVALAAVMLLLILGFAGWLLFFVASTRPRSFLFDDLPTVLLYGSLYNTYSDDAAPFALIPVLLTFVRGIAIGAVQPSGIAQLVILAICEVITILTLHAFRPFHSPTSMNAFHTIFATLRATTVLLMISFAPSLGVTEGPKGWVGYSILLIHAVVMVFGFLLNAVQTIVEVAARMAGAGGDESGAARGGLAKVFGMRQLSKRLPRGNAGSRQSQLSNVAMLDSEDRKSYLMGEGRLRSQSAGSQAILLNRQSTGGIDSNSLDPYGAIPAHQLSGNSAYTPTTPGEASMFSFLPSAPAPSGQRPELGIDADVAATDSPYYRPPRYRRPTLETPSPGVKSRGSWASGDPANRVSSQPASTTPDMGDAFEGPSISGRASPAPQTFDAIGNALSPRRVKADYTTRESDFYYGVRGPALNANVLGRRIKTGPADPTGPTASALGWMKGIFGGKTKEKGKGFEVVRSARMPPGMMAKNAPAEAGVPEGLPVATEGVRNGPIDSDDESDQVHPPLASTSRPGPSHTGDGHQSDNLVSPLGSDDEFAGDDGDFEITRISDVPPMLPGIEVGQDGIELPSRFPSKATSKAGSQKGQRVAMTDVPLVPGLPSRVPTVPRKSSRRKSQSVDLTESKAGFLKGHYPQSSLCPSQHQPHSSVDSSRLPFERTRSGRPTSSISAKSSIEPENPNSVLGHFSADVRDDRPTSMGFVNRNSIRTVTPSGNPDHRGSTAEIIDGHSGSSSLHNHEH